MHLYFLRHGQSMGNMTGDYSALDQDSLSPLGRQQSESLIERLSPYRFDHIFVSPLQRAYETLYPYLRHNGRQVEIWPELAEACHQAPEPMATGPVRYGNPVELPEWACCVYRLPEPPAHCRPPRGETYGEGLRRIQLIRDCLLERFSGQETSILIVGHGHHGGRLLEMCLNMPPAGLIDHSNTGLSWLEESTPGRFKVRFINRC